jgi:ribokinase
MKRASKPKRAARHSDIVTMGSAVLDSYLSSALFELERSPQAPSGWNACVPLGVKIPLSSLVNDVGGGATNAAVTFARLGARVSSLCRIGTDLQGDFLVAKLKEEGVDTSAIQRDATLPTGQSIILVAGQGERTVLVHRGASARVEAKRIPWAKLSPRWFYVTSLGGDLGFMELLLHRAEQIGARVFWNPGRKELEKGLARMLPLMRRVDVFNVNREEASLLTHQPKRHLGAMVKHLADAPKIALLISDGAHGAYLMSRGCAWHCPALVGKPLNTTGAGDALGSGFVAGFMHTCDLSIGLKLGMKNAQSVMQRMGAKEGILRAWPTEKELARIKITPAKLT